MERYRLTTGCIRFSYYLEDARLDPSWLQIKRVARLFYLHKKIHCDYGGINNTKVGGRHNR